MPMDETVGLDSMLQEVWRCITEDKIPTIVGIYGIGGIGKTTLLYGINNMFKSVSHDFNEVILVTVSKQPDMKEIQETILRKYHGYAEHSRPVEENAMNIFGLLKQRKFVLLLDDIWERLDLNHIGVPLPNDQNEAKVIFTTRSEEVCGLMGAQRNIKVECLTQEDALRLFWMKVGENTLNSDSHIPKLAEAMAVKCRGLLLALVTVGRAMACKNHRDDWELDTHKLRNAPSEFPNMDVFLLPLKFSFDHLQNDTLKSCFLYCCLFPEDHNIKKEILVEHWKADGFLDEYENSCCEGEYIIRSLKRVCLLENGESEEFVKMHGLIHEMACRECKEKNAVYIKSEKAVGIVNIRLNEERKTRRWNEVERMSLWDYSIEDVEISLQSSMEDVVTNITLLPNLHTMIYRVPMLTRFPAGYFPLMSALRLLDLSHSFFLHELPMEVSKLINLEYLNISETSITEALFGLGVV